MYIRMYVFMPILTRFLYIYICLCLLVGFNGIENLINSSMDLSYFVYRIWLRLYFIIKMRFQYSDFQHSNQAY